MSKPYMLFAGNSHLSFARQLAMQLGVELHEPDESDGKGPQIKWFTNGNVHVDIKCNVRGRHCFVVQTQSPGRALIGKDDSGADIFGPELSVSDMVLELFWLVDALKTSGARVTVIMPYMPYIRSDKKDHARNSIGAKLFADLIASCGADGVLLMEPHFQQIHGFFPRGRVKVDTLNMKPIFATEIIRQGLGVTLVAPDIGEAKHLGPFADMLGVPVAIINKGRARDDETAKAQHLVGEVEGRDLWVIDDETMSCGTLIEAANFCQTRGAQSMKAAIAHPVLSVPGGIQLVQEHPLISELVVTDTIPVPEVNRIPKMRIVSVVPYFADAIRILSSREDGNSLDAFKQGLYAEMKRLRDELRSKDT